MEEYVVILVVLYYKVSNIKILVITNLGFDPKAKGTGLKYLLSSILPPIKIKKSPEKITLFFKIG